MQTVDKPNWCNDTMWRPPFSEFVSSAFCPGSSPAPLPQGDNQQFRPSLQSFCGRGNVAPGYSTALPVSIPPAYSSRPPTLLRHRGIHQPVAQIYQQPNMFMSQRTFLPTSPIGPPPVQMPNMLSPPPRSMFIPSQQSSVSGKKPCNQGISLPLPQIHQNPNMVTNQRPFLPTQPMGPPQPLMPNTLSFPSRKMYTPVPRSSAVGIIPWKESVSSLHSYDNFNSNVNKKPFVAAAQHIQQTSLSYKHKSINYSPVNTGIQRSAAHEKMVSARSRKPQVHGTPCHGQRSSSPSTLQRITCHHRDYMDRDPGRKQRARDSSKSRGLRCYSPPPPDVERVMSHIIPDAFYSKSSKDEDIAQIIFGTESLKELHQKFEKEILNMEPILDQDSNSEEDLSSTKGENGMDKSDFHCGHERDDGSAILSNVLTSDSDVDSDIDSTEEGSQALSDSSDSFDIDNDDDDNDSNNGDDDDDDAEEEHFNKGPSVKEIRKRKMKHSQRLHPELWFNEKGETNDGPICRCSTADKTQGICHSIYPGEKAIPKCNPLGNNADILHHYWVTVTPHTNFMTENPTVIKVDRKDYTFEGFSLFCHQPLQEVPACSVIRFNIEYFLHVVKEPIPQNFCVQDLELFSQFLFHKVLELSDWDLNGSVPDTCQQYHFMPRFVYRDPDKSESKEEQHKLLSMNYVLSHIIDSAEPLIKPYHFCLPFDEWREFVKSCVNSIVIRPDKKPAALRVDDLKFYEESDELSNKKDYPYIVHHGIRPVQMSFAGDPKYQKLWKSYIKLRNFISNTAVPSRKHQDKLVQLKVQLATMRMASSMRRDVVVEVSSRGMIKSGLKSDVCQHALLLPVLVHHLRYHRCLQTLDTKLGYVFTDRSLMQLALTHPSYHLNFGMNPDHARNSLSNCGVKQPRYGDRKIRHLHTRKKGITQLIRVMSNLGKMEEHHSMIRHNERLEYLGDAVLELICSVHLYFMFPSKSEGSLAMYRSALVQNKNLAQLAKKLELSAYMQYAHGPDLCMVEDLNHAMANCFEALLGAMFLESGLESATDLFTKLAFEDQELREVWTNLSQHPLQAQQPGGDRHLISSSALLQKLVEFEKASGIEFSHIRLLARAFTHPQVGFNNLTLGSNQRMEFLGDSLLKFVVSEYLFKHFPNHHEGHLTLLRSSLVNHRIQAAITKDLGLNELINFGTKGLKTYRGKLLADVLEAFIAALYVDKGLKHVEVFCRVCLFSRLEDLIINQDWIDAKSQLQQCCLSSREEGKTPDVPQYKVLQNKGPAHHKRYTVAVYWKGKRLGSGEGKSRRQAEMLAAKDALSSRYFPEMARQKHLLDRKHKWRRRNHWNKEPRKPRKNKTKEDIGFEPCWEEKDIFEENEQKRKLEGEEDFPKESKILKLDSEVSDSNA